LVAFAFSMKLAMFLRAAPSFASRRRGEPMTASNRTAPRRRFREIVVAP
jgi:hypothetical protein